MQPVKDAGELSIEDLIETVDDTGTVRTGRVARLEPLFVEIEVLTAWRGGRYRPARTGRYTIPLSTFRDGRVLRG